MVTNTREIESYCLWRLKGAWKPKLRATSPDEGRKRTEKSIVGFCRTILSPSRWKRTRTHTLFQEHAARRAISRIGILFVNKKRMKHTLASGHQGRRKRDRDRKSVGKCERMFKRSHTRARVSEKSVIGHAGVSSTVYFTPLATSIQHPAANPPPLYPCQRTLLSATHHGFAGTVVCVCETVSHTAANEFRFFRTGVCVTVQLCSRLSAFSFDRLVRVSDIACCVPSPLSLHTSSQTHKHTYAEFDRRARINWNWDERGWQQKITRLFLIWFHYSCSGECFPFAFPKPKTNECAVSKSLYFAR